MAIKPPLARYREKNPNELLLQLFRANQAVVPTDDLAIMLEIRSDPAGRILNVLVLEQPSDEIAILSAKLPELKPGLYFVDLRFDPLNGTPWRSGLCQLEILPWGSLDKLLDVLNLTVTLDERQQIFQVFLDASPSAALATLAQQRLDEMAALITDGFLPYQIGTDQLYTIPDKRQALSASRIRVAGRLRISGRLIELQ